jgi:hypothetical protein
MELFVTNHAAKMYAAANGNNAVEYRANSSEPWALCSPICAWNPAPFEYRKAAQRWIIDAETMMGPVIRRTYTYENEWLRAIKEYTGHKIIFHSGRHAIVHRMKIAKWKDVPRMTRVVRIDGHEFEFLGVTDGRAVLLKGFTTHSVLFSDIKLSPNQPRIEMPNGQPNYTNFVYNAGLDVIGNGYTFRIHGLREGWEMEQ